MTHYVVRCLRTSTGSRYLTTTSHSCIFFFHAILAVHVAASAATLSEVAGIITTLAKDHLSSLLVHPGHATVGVYYLAKRHEVRRDR